MPACPEGHPSTAIDYCDVCGSPMAAGAPPTTQLVPCPQCQSPMEGRFCEYCGFDSALGSPPRNLTPPAPSVAPATGEHGIVPPAGTVLWVATVTADQGHYQRMIALKGPDLDRVEFPVFYPERRIPLHDTDILIGKRSESQGVHPHIDLSIAPADVAVSRSHAILHVGLDAVTVTDLGSTNGTCLNESSVPIPPRRPLPLKSGDRIHVGGWTTITLTAEQP
ncbi:FHA domain-containing protein [Nocardia inohanensis]|uniref:FHA domain-containing protein n=1 Tax=Nocardia inohanensis TaxID=209246 RepID=UPI000833429F|nr:FHA domain-containing protein [Nocardia inohanensis]